MDKEQPTNKFVAQLLRNIATAHMLKGANRFRIIAYEKAADRIENLSQELFDIWKKGELYSVEGIGSGIGSSLEEYFKTGTSKHFDEVLKGVPETVFFLQKVPGIGPKTAFRLVQKFKLENIQTVADDVVDLAKNGEIAKLEGFGKKSEQDIIQSLQVYRNHDNQTERLLLGKADKIFQQIKTYLETHTNTEEIIALGSLRRGEITIGDVDIAVKAKEEHAQNIIDTFISYPAVRSVEGAGDKKASILVTNNVRVDLRVQTSESWGSMLQYFTGNKAHNIKLREYAQKKGFSLNEYGLLEKDKTEKERKVFQNEKDIYAFLGLQYIPPELRDGTNEIELAEKRAIPKLMELNDITGDLHTHSSYQMKTSHDYGTHTYSELVKGAKSMNYEYIGFSDHNPKSTLNSKEIVAILKKRKQYIDNNLSTAGLAYFIGLEVDILASGELPLPQEAFAHLDYVIISIHSSFRMEKDLMTDRILSAMRYPKVKFFGHPTGRLIQKRESLQADWDAIFQYAKQKQIALEINANPHRLDLPYRLVRKANDIGCFFSINTDAHDLKHLTFMKYGVQVARKGLLPQDRVVNAWNKSKITSWIQDSNE